MTLYKTLQSEFIGLKCWHDMEKEPNAIEMKKGVRESACFLMFLSDGYMEREWCQKEITWALDMGKKFVIVYEIDKRHGGMSFEEHREQSIKAFPQCEKIFNSANAAVAIKYQTEADLVKGMLKQIIDRSGLLLNAKVDVESPPQVPTLAFQ